LIPGLRTYREALFCGHFGPMGVGALFLTMEARGELETNGSSVPFGKSGLPVCRLHE
jgi:NhaP-type Na+/H+ or K+/H+ antiporter